MLKKLLVVFLVMLLVFSPLFAVGQSEVEDKKDEMKQVGEVSGGALGAVGGAVGGLAISAATIAKGAAAGAAAGSIVPGVGNVVGAVAGAAVGAVVGTVSGSLIGSAIGNANSNIDSEFINVITKFSYSQPGGDRIETIVYGAEGSNAAGQYFVPDFNIGQDVILNIEMTPSLNESAYSVKDELKNDRVEIPVSIKISNAKNVVVTKESGVGGNLTPIEDLQGNVTYSFTIKNENTPKTVRFRFAPSGADAITISVTYSEGDKPITTKDSNIFATIHFKEI